MNTRNKLQEQLDDIRHALGWTQTPNIKRLGWRNHYQSDLQIPHLDELVDQGYMVRRGTCYYVTKSGGMLIGMTKRQVDKLALPEALVGARKL